MDKTENFIFKAKKVHGENYDYNFTMYEAARNKILRGEYYR